MEANVQNLITTVLSKLDVVKGPDPEGNYIAWCPFHEDGHGKAPHRANLSVSEKGFNCFACDKKGGLGKLAKHLGVEMVHSEPERVYSYTDESGNILYQVVRFPGKKFYQRRPDGQDGVIWNLKGTRRVLYRLPQLIERQGEPVFIVEGEKDAENLAAQGLLATTNPGGAGKWRPEYSDALKGRDVVILPDNDEPGRKHGSLVANSLLGIARSVKIVKLPDLKDKGDVTDWLNLGHSKAELLDLVARAEPIRTKIELRVPDESISKMPPRESQADQLVRMVLESDNLLFTDQKGEAYARYQTGDHHEIWPISSKPFKRHISGVFYEVYNKVPGDNSIKNALNIIEGEAHRRNIRHRLFNRVACDDKGLLYDLSDDKWRAVRITKYGWEVVADPPILFRRYSHQMPQVLPIKGGILDDIFNFINLGREEDQLLLLNYIISCFVPDIPHPICFLYGPQGSAKTMSHRIMRQLIDLSKCDTMAFPTNEMQLIQILSHHWAAYFDNMSNLPSWASDALCRAVTG